MGCMMFYKAYRDFSLSVCAMFKVIESGNAGQPHSLLGGGVCVTCFLRYHFFLCSPGPEKVLIRHSHGHRAEPGSVNRRMFKKDRWIKSLLLIRFSPQTSLSPSDLCISAGQPEPNPFVFGILFK